MDVEDKDSDLMELAEHVSEMLLDSSLEDKMLNSGKIQDLVRKEIESILDEKCKDLCTHCETFIVRKLEENSQHHSPSSAPTREKSVYFPAEEEEEEEEEEIIYDASAASTNDDVNDDGLDCRSASQKEDRKILPSFIDDDEEIQLEEKNSLLTSSDRRRHLHHQQERHKHSKKDGDNHMSSMQGNQRDDDIVEVSLNKDSYSIMMMSPPLTSSGWWYGFMMFAIQATLFSMVLSEQIELRAYANVHLTSLSPTLLVGEFFSIIFLFTIQDDIIDAIKICTIFFLMDEERDRHLNSANLKSILMKGDIALPLSSFDFSENTQEYWQINRWIVLIPNILKFLQGLLALGTSFMIVISSDSTINLFKDFAALSMISFIDDVSFKLCQDGVLGAEFVKLTEHIEDVKLKRYRLKSRKVPLQTFIFGFLLLVLYGTWGCVVTSQMTGAMYRLTHPKCKVPSSDANFLHRHDKLRDIGDGKCHKWSNNIECDFDGGDCIFFNMEFNQACDADEPWKVGDSKCDTELLNAGCKFDKGDCCVTTSENSMRLGDGKCDMIFNNLKCGYDDLDCFVVNYPECRMKNGEDPTIIGDGTCHEEYNIEECGYDDGDCCKVPIPSLLGNGECNGAEYNVPECFFDRGDCTVVGYPDCHVYNPNLVGNEQCEGYDSIYNTESCGFDDGDCNTVVLNSGISSIKINRLGYIDNDTIYYDGYAIGAKRISDYSTFWSGYENTGVSGNYNPPFISSKVLPLLSDGMHRANTTMIVDDNELKVTHVYESTAIDNVFQTSISYENLSNDTFLDLRYRKEINWQSPDKEECTSLLLSAIPDALEYFTNDGFQPLRGFDKYANRNDGVGFTFSPSRDGSYYSIESGLHRNGALFQFLFKTPFDGSKSTKGLAPGEKLTFDLFYGEASDREKMSEALSALYAEVAVYGYLPTSSDCELTVNPDKFSFVAFRGVGGKPIFRHEVRVSYFHIDKFWTSLPFEGLHTLSPFKTSNVETIYFTHGTDNFIDSGLSDYVAALFEGHLLFPKKESTYFFCLTSDDGSKMFVNDELIINNDGLHGATKICANYTGSGLQKVTVEFFELTGEAILLLEWKPPGTDSLTMIPITSWIPMENVKVFYYDVSEFDSNFLPPSGLSNSTLTPFKSEMIETINYPQTLEDFAGSGLEDNVAALFVGYLQFKSEGVYSICMSSDDGSKLYIDDVLLIDNDGKHAVVTKCEDVLNIQRWSIKKITIEYMELTVSAALKLEWIEPLEDELKVLPPTSWIPELYIFD